MSVMLSLMGKAIKAESGVTTGDAMFTPSLRNGASGGCAACKAPSLSHRA